MGNWTPAEWQAFLNSLGIFVGVVLGAAATFYAALAKIRSEANTKKIDENTALTKEGTHTAATNAKIAADTAGAVVKKANEISDRLNGGLSTKIQQIVKEHTDPIVQELNEHMDQDETNMVEIRNLIAGLNKTFTKQGG